MVDETFDARLDSLVRLFNFIHEELPGGSELLMRYPTMPAAELAIKLLRERVVAADVPVFVIKGTDKIAPEAVDSYRNLCASYGLFAQADEVEAAYHEMRDWQSENPDRVKLPDHKHVPLTSGS